MDSQTFIGIGFPAGDAAAPANENIDPFLQADTALDELYRIRRAVLARDPSDFTPEQWRERKEALTKLDKAIRTCLSCL
jgi:hypothetical protein